MPDFRQWLKSYQNRNLLLLAGTVFILFLCYRISIRKTLNVRSQYLAKLDLVQRAQQQDVKLEELQQEMEVLKTSSLQSYDREELLLQITAFSKANKLMVSSFPEAEFVEVAKHGIFTNKIELKGGYHDIVEMAYLIEQKERLAAISSLRFFLQKNKKTKKQELHASLIIRNLRT